MGVKVSDLTTESAPASTDILLIADPTTGLAKKITVSALKTYMDGLGGGGDTTAPVIVSATAVTANTIQIIFSESVTVTTAGWSFKLNGANWVISSVTGSGNTWTFTMATSGVSTDTILRSYSSTTGATVDTSANELVTFTDSAVTNSIPAGSSYDSDATAFFTATGITDTTQKDAVNGLVVSLKAASLWTKMTAIYPFVGGTAATHKYNLKNPVDTDGGYRLTFTGGFTHNANGATGDGSTGYADTHLKHSNFTSPLSSYHISIYSRTNSNPTDQYDVDVATTSQMGVGLILKSSGNARSNSNQSGFGTGISTAVTTSQKLFVSSRSTATTHKLYQDGTQIGSTDTADQSAAGANTNNFVLWANTNNGTPSTGSYLSSRNFAFASFGDGLSDAEVTSLTNAVNTYQTALSRNV